ncbi:MAG: alpha/beta hydrolase [Acidimicrobiales bacterium]
MAIELEQFVDADHLAVLRAIPAGTVVLDDIPRRRAAFAAAADAAPMPMPDDVTISEETAPGVRGAPAVRVKVYRRNGVTNDVPGLYWIHGGGMVLGSADRDDPRCAWLASKLGIVVASVDYRLAPEHPYPAPMDDCYSGLSWFASNASALGVDSARLAIGGASAGAGLAAGLALLARDLKAPAICFQLLIYPMIDDTNTTPSSYDIIDDRVWNRAANIVGWESYVGGLDDIPIYAAPARADDLSGLPPAYVSVGTLDMFLDEDISYARKLLASGVPTELHVYPGAFHGSNGLVPKAALTRRWIADEHAALVRALGL